MSSGNTSNSNIFDRLDTISESLDSVSRRLETLETASLGRQSYDSGKESESIRLFPGIIERITSSSTADEVINGMLEAFQPSMNRSLVLSLAEGGFHPIMSRGYGKPPEKAGAPELGESDLLEKSVDSRQIMILKGKISEQIPFADQDDSRIRYGIFIPFLFGEQVPLVYFGESLDKPDLDFLESVVNLSALAMKNLQLNALLAQIKEPEDSEPQVEKEIPAEEKIQVEAEFPVDPVVETEIQVEEMLEESAEEEGKEEEEAEEARPEAEEVQAPGTLDEQKKPFRSVHDFDSDIISAEELIRSFNIDIKENMPDEVESAEEEKEPGTGFDEGMEEEDRIILEEEVSAEAESPDLEVEIPMDDAADDLTLQEEEISVDISPEPAPDQDDIEKELARIEAELESETGPETAESPEAAETGEEAAVMADEGETSPEDIPEPVIELPESVIEEAQTFARLLVSEIKLYNENKVKEGREKGNIYNKLQEEIELSRSVYNDRIPEQVRKSTDFFDEELVRILAEGDESVVGNRP